MGVGMASTGSSFEDLLLDSVTDAGKGAYIYIDTKEEAYKMFGDHFISNLDVAARDVEVELNLPPSFEIISFHGEAYAADREEVEPQHLAPNDAMIFHQEIASCDATAYTLEDHISVKVYFEDPITREQKEDKFESSIGALLDNNNARLLKGNAVVAYAETLKALKSMSGQAAEQRIDETLAVVDAAAKALAGDPDLAEIANLLTKYKEVF
jgi:Ca-activated chloride channel family protein